MSDFPRCSIGRRLRLDSGASNRIPSPHCGAAVLLLMQSRRPFQSDPSRVLSWQASCRRPLPRGRISPETGRLYVAPPDGIGVGGAGPRSSRCGPRGTTLVPRFDPLFTSLLRPTDGGSWCGPEGRARCALRGCGRSVSGWIGARTRTSLVQSMAPLLRSRRATILNSVLIDRLRARSPILLGKSPSERTPAAIRTLRDTRGFVKRQPEHRRHSAPRTWRSYGAAHHGGDIARQGADQTVIPLPPRSRCATARSRP